FRTLLKDRVIRGLFLQRLVAASGQGCVYSFLPLLGLGMNVSGSQVGVILGANILVIAFLQRSFGAIADRVNPLHQIVLGTLLSGMAILVMPLAGGYGGLLALNVVMGLGTGIASPAGLALGARIGRSVGMASVMGLSEAGFSMGMIASPIFSGLIMDALGLPSIFLTGGGLILLGTWPVFLYLRGYEEK
ncbi:MAG: MFS transporter, partial [Thermodesulfobacteriota bacterium]